MQATQSNNASDFFESDSTGPRDVHSGFHSIDGRIRDLPSPFTAPIQATRKYLERQRSAASQADSEAAAALASGAERPAVHPPAGRDQNTRERDRRLERSLYEGHSIEAGLSFDDPHSLADSGRAFLTDSDGSEPLFPYAAPGLVSRQVPHPETVRGAIFRLARDSEKTLQPPKAAPAQVWADDLVKIQTESPIGVEAAPPSAFADVARRVWGDIHEEEGTAVSAGLSVAEREHASSSRAYLGANLGAVPDDAANEPCRTAEAGYGNLAAALPVRVHQLEAQPSQSRVMEGQAEELPCGNAFDDAALAHDACNLLSAVGLYSDLLNLPGVLAESHRHYAEELKLIAGRSQRLIDRMLKLSETDGRVMLPVQQTEGRTGIHVTPKPAAATAAIPAGQAGSPSAEAIAAASPAVAPKEVQTTSFVDLLMRWGSLLSTLAHGTLDICFGPRAGTPVSIEAEPLERILVNLVRNARAATLAGGAIRIGVVLSEESTPGALDTNALDSNAPDKSPLIVLTVDDSGCGMTQAQIARILGSPDGCAAGSELMIGPEANSTAALPYQPIEETASDGYGRWLVSRGSGKEDAVEVGAGNLQWPSSKLHETQAARVRVSKATDRRRKGLGLQVVRNLVQASGGTLAIISSPGRGTRVEIRWPVAAVPALAELPVPVTRLDDVAMAAPETTLKHVHIKAQTASQPPPTDVGPADIGPDGFSEAELRAMMLRLHRHGSQPSRVKTAQPCSHSGARRFEADNHSVVKGAIAC